MRSRQTHWDTKRDTKQKRYKGRNRAGGVDRVGAREGGGMAGSLTGEG